MADPTYNPGVFAVGTIEQAKGIILTPEDSTTEVGRASCRERVWTVV